MDISISLSTALTKVRRLATYRADRDEKSEDTYDTIGLVPAENEILEPLFVKACHNVFDRLRQYVDSFSDNGDGYTLSVTLPDYQSGSVSDLENAIADYVSMEVLSDWYDECQLQDAKTASDKADSILDSIVIIAMHHQRPTRHNITPDDAPWKDVIIEGEDEDTTTTSSSDDSTSTTDGAATESTNDEEEES